MDARLQRRIQRYGWDKAAGSYESSWRAQLAPAQDKLLELAALQPGEHVLDIACGTGLVALPAAEAVGSAGLVLGTDLADNMVAAAASRAQEARLRHARFARMDAEQLELPDTSMDAVLCALGLMYVPDPLQALREMHRVAKPGGRSVAAVWGARANCGWAGIFEVVDARVKTEVCPMFFHLGTGGMLERVFEAAGFTSVQAVRIRTMLEYATPEQACEAAFAGGPVALAYSRFSSEMRLEAHDAYLSTIETYRHGAGYRIPGEFVVVRGCRPLVQ
ncbi:MAG: methyltransferase domain-containing protein [Bryobacterales bacterium]|nr:methyltransferase domain-containing protein [Bryobacterales bacterium]